MWAALHVFFIQFCLQMCLKVHISIHTLTYPMCVLLLCIIELNLETHQCSSLFHWVTSSLITMNTPAAESSPQQMHH